MSPWIVRLCAAVVAAFSIASTAHADESLFDVVKKRGTLVAGVKNDYPPAGYVDRNGD